MKLSRLPTVVATACASLLAAAASAFAATGEQTPLKLDEDAPARAASPGGGGGLLRTLFGLAVVVAVIYAIYWILKQVKASREERASGSGLTAIASLPLGAGRSLHMVRAGSEVLVVGAAEHGVTPIRTYGEVEAREAGLLDGITEDDAAAGWRDLSAPYGATALHDAPPPSAPAGANGASSPPSVRAVLESMRRRTVRR
ncbi:MAG: flagellar biosynthetic protein FliO [Actinomycetota bacterium]|nr:flagellar biosynthetic protein FliO [Actinomycetota bacterium]